jgi:hypothetical protein
MGMTMAYGTADNDDATSIATIRRAFELGVTLFDTAEPYGGGTGANEKLVGEAVKDFRADVTIATKFGFHMSDPTSQASTRVLSTFARLPKTTFAICRPTPSTSCTSIEPIPTCRSRTSRAPSRISSTPARSVTSA